MCGLHFPLARACCRGLGSLRRCNLQQFLRQSCFLISALMLLTAMVAVFILSAAADREQVHGHNWAYVMQHFESALVGVDWPFLQYAENQQEELFILHYKTWFLLLKASGLQIHVKHGEQYQIFEHQLLRLDCRNFHNKPVTAFVDYK